MIIENYKPIHKGVIIATFNLKIPKWGNFLIKGITLFEKNGGRWISFPSQAYTNQQGEKKYSSHCYFEDKDMHVKFQEIVMEAIKSHLEKNPSLKNAPKIQEKEAYPESNGVPF
jgi:hypothetical protein